MSYFVKPADSPNKAQVSSPQSMGPQRTTVIAAGPSILRSPQLVAQSPGLVANRPPVSVLSAQSPSLVAQSPQLMGQRTSGIALAQHSPSKSPIVAAQQPSTGSVSLVSQRSPSLVAQVSPSLIPKGSSKELSPILIPNQASSRGSLVVGSPSLVAQRPSVNASPTLVQKSPSLVPSRGGSLLVAPQSPSLVPQCGSTSSGSCSFVVNIQSPNQGHQKSPILIAKSSPSLIAATSPSLVPQKLSPLLAPQRETIVTRMTAASQHSSLTAPISSQARFGPGAQVGGTAHSLLSSMQTASAPQNSTKAVKVSKSVVTTKVVQSSLPTEEVDEEEFALPAPAVDNIDSIPGAKGSLLGQSAQKVESSDDDGSDFDADVNDRSMDKNMVRSPCGTRWVKIKKEFPLDTKYCIWFESGQNKKRHVKDQKAYEASIQSVGTFKTVQEFWQYWNCIDLGQMANFSTLSVFKHPIKPMWEDAANKHGGRWILTCSHRRNAEEFFAKLVMSLIGGYFECHESLCGVVYSVKPKMTVISLWNNKVDPSLFTPVDFELRELLGLENDPDMNVEYRDHNGAILNNQVQRGAAEPGDILVESEPLAPVIEANDATPSATVAQAQVTSAAVASSSSTTVLKKSIPVTHTTSGVTPIFTPGVGLSYPSTSVARHSYPVQHTGQQLPTQNGIQQNGYLYSSQQNGFLQNQQQNGYQQQGWNGQYYVDGSQYNAYYGNGQMW